MGKNKWRSYKHRKVNSWEATFKDPAMHDLSLIIAFLTGVLEAGERERVLMIKEEGGQFPYHKSMGISYAQHMNNVFEKYEKILPVYDSLYPVSRLCYYDIKVFHLTIYTKTDIWQPKLFNVSGDDNLELAMCHTPRLNRFLADFKRLTLEFGGEWVYSDGIPLP